MGPGKTALGSLAVLTLTLALLGLSGCTGGKAEKWFHKGVRAHRNLDDRISHYSKAIALKPDYAFAYNNRGLAYSKQGRHDKAIADLNKAIGLLKKSGDNLNLAIAHDSRGVAQAKSGRHDRAIADYDKAIQLNPNYGLAYYNRGLAHKIQGRSDRTIRDYTEAIRLKPGYAPAYINRGIFLQDKGVHDRAIFDFQKAITLRSKFAHAYSYLAWAFATTSNAALRNGERAVELVERSVALDRTGHNLDTLSAAYAEMGRFADAVRTQSQAIGLLKKSDGERSRLGFERHLERYRIRKPWRMARRESSPDRPISQQGLEALSGRYTTAGGRSQWDIMFRGDRFQARYLHQGKWSLLYDGELTGARIIGRIHHGSRSICRRLSTTMLFGRVDLRRKSFEISWGDYDVVQMIRHKQCVPAISRRKWTRSDRL